MFNSTATSFAAVVKENSVSDCSIVLPPDVLMAAVIVVPAGWTRPTTGCIMSYWIFGNILIPVAPISPVDVATSEFWAVIVNESNVMLPIAV